MKRLATSFLLVGLSAFTTVASAAPTWTSLPTDSPGNHQWGAAVVAKAPGLGGTDRIYVIGGGYNSIDFARVDMLDPVPPLTWSTSAYPFPGTPTYHHAAVAAPDGSIYVLGGADATNSNANAVWQFVPSPPTWTQRTSYPGPQRADIGAVVANDGVRDCIFIFGGKNTTTGAIYNNAYKYPFTGPSANTWVTLSNSILTGGCVAVRSCDNKIYLDGAYKYDPVTATWDPNSPCVNPFGGTSAAMCTGSDGKIYGAGGGFNCATNAVWSWDRICPGPGGPEASLPHPLGGMPGTSYGNYFYVFGGENKASCGPNYPTQAIRYGPLGSCSSCAVGQCLEVCAAQWKGATTNLWRGVSTDWEGGFPTTERALLWQTGTASNICILNTSESPCGVTVRGTSGTQTQILQINSPGTLSPVNDALIDAYGIVQINAGGSLITPTSPAQYATIAANGIVEMAGGAFTGFKHMDAGGILRGYGFVNGLGRQYGTVEGSALGSGVLDVTAGSYSGFPNYGAIRVVPNSTVYYHGLALGTNYGSIDIQAGGTFRCAGVQNNLGGHQAPGDGRVDVHGGILRGDGGVVVQGVDARLCLADGATVQGPTLNVFGSGILTCNAGTNFINSTLSLNAAGVFQMLPQTNTTASGPITVGSTGVINIASGALLSAPTLTNAGQVNIAAGSKLTLVGAYSGTGPTLLALGVPVSIVNCEPCLASIPTEVLAETAKLNVAGNFVSDAASSVSFGSALAQISGNFDVAIDTGSRFALVNATLQLTGNPANGNQTVEVMAPDAGPSVLFEDSSHFGIGTLRLGPTTATIKLVNNRGAAGQVLYVRHLLIDAGVTLDLAGRRIYYGDLVQGTSTHITDSVGGGALSQGAFTYLPVDVQTPVPAGSLLTVRQNVPNPFNPVTVITFSMARAGHVAIRVYDIRGGLVATLHVGDLEAGQHSVRWSGRNTAGESVSSGLYFCRSEGLGESHTISMTLLK